MNSTRLRVAAVALNQTPLDWDGNQRRINEQIAAAKNLGVQVLCFPELCITGYNCEDMFLSLHTARMSERILSDLLPVTHGLATILGMPVYHSGAMYNCAVVVQNGRVLGIHPKKALPREGVHYESRWFRPGYPGQSEHVKLMGERIPFGDFRYDFGAYTMAVDICEEAWQSEPASAKHARCGVDLVLNPSASHFAFGKYHTRESLVRNNSRAMQVHYVHCNLLGSEAGRMIYDGGALIASCGQIVARGPRFGFSDGYLTLKDLDMDLARVGKLRHRVEKELEAEDDEAKVIVSPLQIEWNKSFAPVEGIDRIYFEAKKGCWELSKEEEFMAAVMLGLFDYLRKSRSKGFVISLSGGCDSAATMVLVAQMVVCALNELGESRFVSKLGLSVDANASASDPRTWIGKILTTLYQATENSSAVTKAAAKAVAESVGANHLEFGVQDLVESYLTKASKGLGRSLSWQEDDLALQNIQARARAPLAWLIANLQGALLLATSNRSEVAVGYATMDGDTAGGLAPLGGIDKAFLRHWMLWAERECRWGLGPIAALRQVNSLAPTAELRPPDQTQCDEDDLMPYSVLTRIEQLMVHDLKAPEDILAYLTEDFPSFSAANLKAYLSRFLRLWAQNQWKRERYAPSFLLDEQSLDPKTWCRYPILSGAFGREIREL